MNFLERFILSAFSRFRAVVCLHAAVNMKRSENFCLLKIEKKNEIAGVNNYG